MCSNNEHLGPQLRLSGPHPDLALPCARQVEIILTFEEFCGEEGEFAGDQGSSFATIFPQA